MVVLLGVALVLCGALARRYPVAPAILLVLVGVLVGFVPQLRQVQLPPEVVLLLFLPALLYWETLTIVASDGSATTWRVVPVLSSPALASDRRRAQESRTGSRWTWTGGRRVLYAALVPERGNRGRASWPATCRGAR